MKRITIALFAVLFALSFLSSCNHSTKKATTPDKTNQPKQTQTTEDTTNAAVSVLDTKDKASVTLLQINCSKEALSDSKVRRALAFALERKTLAKSNHAFVLNAVIPNIIPFSINSPTISYRTSVGAKLVESPDFAKLLLSQAGYADGKNFPQLTIIVPEEYNAQDIIMKLASNLKVFINVSALSEQKYKEALESGAYDIALVTLPCAPDATNFLKNFTQIPSWDNKDYKTVVSELEKMSDDTMDKLNFFEIAEGILTDDMPVIPLYYTKIK